MDMEKLVSPFGTKDALEWAPPAVTPTVPVMEVTAASMTAISVMLSCPVTVWRLMVSRVVDTHSEATVPSMLPGVQPRELTRMSQSSPSTDGRG